MNNIQNSIFWNKALSVNGCNPTSLSDIVENQELVQQFRTIAGYSMLEGNFKVTNDLDTFFLDTLTLRLLNVNVKDIEINSSLLIEHVVKAYDIQPTPPFVEICTITSCTRRCKSCVQGYMNSDIKVMSKDVWQESVKQLNSIYRKKLFQNPVVHLHWYTEPLMDPTLIEKLEELKQRGINTVVLITNGNLLSQAKLEVLSNLCLLVIICAKSSSIYDKYKHNNSLSRNVACIDHSYYHDNVQGFNRCGSTFGFKAKMPITCRKGMNINIDYNGDIYMCCNDMSKTYSVGNILQDKFMNIWGSSEIMSIQGKLMSYGFHGAPCSACTYREVEQD